MGGGRVTFPRSVLGAWLPEAPVDSHLVTAKSLAPLHWDNLWVLSLPQYFM